MTDQSAHHIEQLDSTDPDVRRAAMAALRDSGDPQAVEPLLKMAQTDPDMTLRHLAQEAAYAIGSAMQPVSVIRPIDPPSRQVTGREKRLARRLLNRALNLQIAGNKEQAATALAEALRTDPDIVNNQSLRHLAMHVTNLPTEQAIAYLIQRSKDPFVTFDSDRKPVFVVTPEMTRLTRDIGFLFVLMIPLSLVLVYWSNLLSATSHINLLQTSAPLNTPLATALAIVRASVILWAGILFANISSFFIGQLMGGIGLLYGYLKTMIRLQIGVVLVVAGLIVLNAVTILAVPAANWQSVTLTVLTLSILGTIAGSIIAHAYLIKRAHEFDFAKGVLTSVLSAVVIAVLVGAASGLFRR